MFDQGTNDSPEERGFTDVGKAMGGKRFANGKSSKNDVPDGKSTATGPAEPSEREKEAALEG